MLPIVETIVVLARSRLPYHALKVHYPFYIYNSIVFSLALNIGIVLDYLVLSGITFMNPILCFLFQM